MPERPLADGVEIGDPETVIASENALMMECPWLQDKPDPLMQGRDPWMQAADAKPPLADAYAPDDGCLDDRNASGSADLIWHIDTW